MKTIINNIRWFFGMALYGLYLLLLNKNERKWELRQRISFKDSSELAEILNNKNDNMPEEYYEFINRNYMRKYTKSFEQEQRWMKRLSIDIPVEKPFISSKHAKAICDEICSNLNIERVKEIRVNPDEIGVTGLAAYMFNDKSIVLRSDLVHPAVMIHELTHHVVYVSGLRNDDHGTIFCGMEDVLFGAYATVGVFGTEVLERVFEHNRRKLDE